MMLLPPLCPDELDLKVIRKRQGVRFLVLNKLHIYRGRHGADVALLVRRDGERLSRDKLQPFGTSATMADEGTVRNMQEVVVSVASAGSILGLALPFRIRALTDSRRGSLPWHRGHVFEIWTMKGAA